MNTYRKTATSVGILFIIGTLAGILSVLFYGSVSNSPDYLMKISANGTPIILGAMCVLLMGLALALVPLLMYPILKKHNEPLAIGYVVFRGGLETVTYIAMVISQLLLIPLSRAYAAAGAPADSYFQTLGVVIRAAGDLVEPIMAIVFCLGALMFYTVLYQSKLLPRWLSVWGLIAAAIWLAASLLAMLGIIAPQSAIRNAFAPPIFLQEMVMAVWLISKGFNAAAFTTGAVKIDAKQALSELG